MPEMNPVNAIEKALTPGSLFNQHGKIFRSAAALGQFAGLNIQEVLHLVDENLADRVTIRPSQRHPENGPLIALTECIPDQPEEGAVQVKVVGGNAVAGAEEEPVVVGEAEDDDLFGDIEVEAEEEFDPIKVLSETTAAVQGKTTPELFGVVTGAPNEGACAVKAAPPEGMKVGGHVYVLEGEVA